MIIIIIWKQRGSSRHISEAYTMRAVIKPISARTEKPFIIEREYTDAAGGKGWIPASHEHAVAIICKALLQIAERGVATAATTMSIDLGVIDLPEE